MQLDVPFFFRVDRCLVSHHTATIEVYINRVHSPLHRGPLDLIGSSNDHALRLQISTFGSLTRVHRWLTQNVLTRTRPQ